MKKTILITILVLVLLIVGCETPTQEVTKTSEPTKVQSDQKTPEALESTTPKEIQPKEETKPKEPITPDEPEPEPESEFYTMNEDIKVDYLTYKVTKAETFIEMGSSIIKKEADGKYIKVYLEITNNAKETKQIFTPRFTLVDDKSRKYDRLTDDMLYITDVLELGKQLQPGVTVSGAVVFETAKDSKGFGIVIRGDWLSLSEVGVILSGIRDIGKDTTLKDEVDEAMDEAMAEAEKQVEDLMNQCNSPFVCTSSCQQYMDVGQKDCPSGELCCMQS